MTKRLGEILFVATFLVALALYGLTAPDGLPWNASTHFALAHLGEIMRLPVMPHPVWGCYVQVFGGAVALSAFMAALAAGLIALLVNRYFGWRFAVSAALVWMFLPSVWNRAITGERSLCLVAMAVVLAWTVESVARHVLRKAREVWLAKKAGLGGDFVETALSGAEGLAKKMRMNRIAGWVAMGAAVVFSLVALTIHDYRLGEAASVFAKGVSEAAGERCIVLNGVCDDQVVYEVKKRGEARNLSTIFLRNDDAYRTRLVAEMRGAFPTETNLWMAAQVSVEAFVKVAKKEYPDWLYLMNGVDTTLEAWEKRWEAFKPYLKSRDPFVPVARQMFGHEGNSVANAILDEAEKRGGGREKAAYDLYKRIFNEVDPGNLSALVNANEMIRRGHAVSGDEKKKAREELEKFFKDASNRQNAREIARRAGPIRADPALMEKLITEAKKKVAVKIAAGEKVEYSPEILSLVEWNNEMIHLMNRGEIVKAGRIARAILSNSKWQKSVPANVVMGSVSALEGDFASSEVFFKTVMAATNIVPTVVLNDYADTLLNLGKLDEAERLARRSVNESEESFWIARLTLLQVLEKKRQVAMRESGSSRKGPGALCLAQSVNIPVSAEAKDLLRSILKHAPAATRDRIRKEYKDILR